MTQYSLFPSYFVLSYHSPSGVHKMTVPTLQWLASPNVGGSGAFAKHSSGTNDAHDVIHDYAEFLAANFSEDVTIDDYLIYNFDDEDEPPRPVASQTLAIDGLIATPHTPAAQALLYFRTAAFNPFKIYILDAIPSPAFADVLPADVTAAQQDLIDYVIDTDGSIAGRDGTRPANFVRLTNNINDKLRAGLR